MDNSSITRLASIETAADVNGCGCEVSSDNTCDGSPDLSLSVTPSTRGTPPEDLSTDDADDQQQELFRDVGGSASDCQYTCFPVLPASVKTTTPDKVLRCQLPYPKGELTSPEDLKFSPQTLIYAAWALIVGQLTTSDKVSFGVGLNLGESTTALATDHHGGHSKQMLPLYIVLAKNQAILDLLNTIQSQIASAEGRGLPPGAIQRRARTLDDIRALIQFGPSTKPQNNGAKISCLSLERCEETYFNEGSANTDYAGLALALELTCDGAGIHVETKYDSRVLQPWLLSKLLNRLDFVMQQIAGSKPGTLVADIDFMSPTDLSQVWSWNGAPPAAIERCMHDIFQDNAVSHPSAVAVDAWDGQLTYCELDDLSERLAGYLMKSGVTNDTYVPLCFEKSMWMPVSMLGVLKAGGAFVLLDPSLPEQRLRTMVIQVKASAVLCSENTKNLCSSITDQVVIVNRESVNGFESHTNRPRNRQSSSSAMFAVFTSGSTGTPKGAILTHSNYASALTYQLKELGFTPESRVFDFASYAFDVSVHNVFATLTSGSCLCIPSDESRHNDITQSMADMRVTIAHLTPSVSRLVEPESVPTLKTMIFTGEPLPIDDATRWWGKVDIVNEYGPAECTINSVNQSPITPDAATRIGPIVGACGWIVDPDNHNRLLPIGCVGELLIEGAVVGRGYINDDVKNESSFVRNPQWLVRAGEFERCGGGRMYKTGDLVRYADGEGCLAYVGRKDVQVKIRGQRVDLGEVEHWVRSHVPDAEQVAAELITPQDRSCRGEGNGVLAVFLQPKKGSLTAALEFGEDPITVKIRQVPASVQSRLAQHMPSYVVPNVFLWLRKLPVTPTGKMNRKELREMGSSFTVEQLADARTARQGSRVAKRLPSSEMEQTVRQSWATVLGFPPINIGLDDNFFHLGGDSITCMKVVAEGRKLGIRMTVSDIFRYPQLHDLASHCNITLLDHHKDRIPPFGLLSHSSIDQLGHILQQVSSRHGLEPTCISDAFPCTRLQEGLIFLTSKRPGDYMEQSVLELAPEVSTVALRTAWDVAIRAFPILRTRIVQNNDYGLLQVILEDTAQWKETVSGLEDYLQQDRQQSMNVGDALSRYALIRDLKSGKPRWLVWTIHHAIYDGWSIRLVMNSVAKAYLGEAILEPPQFQTFIKYIQDQAEHDEAKYWRNFLHGVEAVTFPPQVPSVQEPVADSVVTHTIANPRSGGITTSMMIRAAWALVLGRMTNRNDVVFGTTLYGRNAAVARLDEMVAPTIATVPVRAKWARDDLVSDYLITIQQEAAEMMSFEQTGLQRIASLSPDAQRACQFQTHLVVQPNDATNGSSVLGNWTSGGQEHWFSTYALTVEVWLGDREIAVSAMFDSRIIEGWLVKRMLQRLESIIEQLDNSRGTRIRLGDISQPTTNELDEIWKWNEAVPQAAQRCVQDLLQDQVSIRPDALAISAWDGDLTYSELDNLSSRLAIRLCQLGACLSENQLVPLCLHKSMWTSVAILGTLKANAGFILLDPGLPRQRLESIIHQVGSKLVISSSSEYQVCAGLTENTFILGWDIFSNQETISHQDLPTCLPSSIAYAIFTSGSTGSPKGVMISHSNIVSALHHQIQALGHTSKSRLFDFASYSFDVAISNLFCMIAVGGCLCIPTEIERTDNPEEAIKRLGANTLDLTPSALQLLSQEALPKVHTLILGGEQLHATDIRNWVGKSRICNAYGPSECTPTSVIHSISLSPERLEVIPIGRGAGVVTWIVDPDNHDDLLPPGCTGELILEGPLVGLGYMGSQNAARTRSSFIEDPKWLLKGSVQFAGRRGRLYKTGDLAKYRPDGTVVFVGRKDAQVKVRGQRVELNEIECVLRSHANVEEAVVVLLDQQTLSAFVTIASSHFVMHDDQNPLSVESKHANLAVRGWEEQFDDEIYASINSAVACQAIGRDFIGWTSMYDGKEIDKGAMNEWLDDTISTILNGGSAGHVLEIGTGSGMMLFNLENHGLEGYVGVEPSSRAVDFTLQAARTIPSLAAKVKVFKGTAIDIFHLEKSLSPRLVVVNSVIQYFPSLEYLFDLIRRLVELDTVETIYLGDVRSYALHKEFLVARALRIISKDTPTDIDEFVRVVENLEKVEPELLVDPGFFTSLPERLRDITHVEILPKKMRETNELSSYRYAAVLHVHRKGKYMSVVRNVDRASWLNYESSNLDEEAVLHLVQDNSEVAICNIPNKKTIFETKVVNHIMEHASTAPRSETWFSSIRENVNNMSTLCALDLFELAEVAGCRVEVSCARQSSQHGGLDAVFYRPGLNGAERDSSTRTMFQFPTDHLHRSTFGNEPLRQKVEANVCEELQDMVATRLPSYMCPQSITILDKMPINRNGKIDRLCLSGLRKADATHASATNGGSVPPCTAMEKAMHSIWCQVLNLEPGKIGVDDGFIQLGGNSLGAMKVISMARQAGFKLQVADMFRRSTTSIQSLLQSRSQQSQNSDSNADTTMQRLLSDIARHDDAIAAAQLVGGEGNRIVGSHLTVVVTGANGFIGTQILRQLLEDGRVGRVIAIVRGATDADAMRRTIEAAKTAQWWVDVYARTLEVWRGDLQEVHLGLGDSNWELIVNGTVDVMIHNGASVHFMKSYAALEAANVASTAQMLCATAKNAHMRFVYVSSARCCDPVTEREEDVAEALASNPNGYNETKFVAEALVKRAAARVTRNRQFFVVSPGLVIGTPTEGVANADDWLWRMAASCIRVCVFNAAESGKWMPISDASIVASSVVGAALNEIQCAGQPVVTQVRGGMTMGEFWSILQSTGYSLTPVDALTCMNAIRADVSAHKDSHPLGALADMLASLGDTTKEEWAESWKRGAASPARLSVALMKNVQFLAAVGFLPKPAGYVDKDATSVGAFTRSGV